MFDVEMRRFAGGTFYHMNHKGDYHGIGAVFGRLGAMIDQNGWHDSVRAMVGVYYDDPTDTPPDEMRSQAGFLATRNIDVTNSPIEKGDLPSGEVAVLTFQGPYDQMVEAYMWFYGAWLEESGRAPLGYPPFEIYLNSPFDTEPEELITEIHMMLQ